MDDGMQMRTTLLFQLGIALLLCGCTTTEPPVVVEEANAMSQQGEQLQPENLLFPEYLCMADFELGQHGRIPGSGLVGASLKTELDLETSLQQFTDLLASESWAITLSEVEEHFFRLLATMKNEIVEIRAVRGSGSTQVFILYRPEADSLL